MYKSKLWDEDKWNIHSEGYNSSKYSNSPKDDVNYHEQKYGDNKDVSSDYMKKEEQEKKDDKKEKSFLESIDDEKKEQKKDEDDDIKIKAAKLVFDERAFAKKDDLKKEKKENLESIDEAIKKAIEDEKKVFVMDN